MRTGEGARRRRSGVRTGGAACLCAVLALAGLAMSCRDGEPEPETESRARVILITLDTLRYDSLVAGDGGEPAMPRLHAWSRRATRFDSFYASTPSTQPSHVSMFTGLPPWEHGLTGTGQLLNHDLETVAERFRAAGFSTGAVVASMPVSALFGFDQGFDRFEDEFASGRLGRGQWLEAARRAAEDEDRAAGDPGDSFYTLADRVTERALEMLDTAGGDRQFFWFHYFDPHAPYGDSAEGPQLSPYEIYARVRAGEVGAETEELVERARALYDGDVEVLDRQLARLLAAIDRDAESIPTHLVLVSDHGESFGERGSLVHGRRLIPSQIHVPCVIRSPRLEPGVRADVASSQDISPTLLALGGLDPEAGSGGEIAARDLTRPPEGRTYALGMRRTWEEPFEDLRLDGQIYVLDEPLFYFVDRRGTLIRGNRHGVEPPHPGEVAPAPGEAERLTALFAGLEEVLAGRRAPSVEGSAVDEGLRALGYVR